MDNSFYTLISRHDADMIFSLTKPQWENKADQFIAPGWTVRTGKLDKGTLVSMFQAATGMTVSIQPLFRGDDQPPAAVVVGNYYPIGILPPMTDERKKDMEATAQRDLAPDYNVSMSYGKLEQLETVELIVVRRPKPTAVSIRKS